MQDLAEILKNNPYPGRGIAVGDGVVYYFIMGRSQNSRNRIFALTDDGIRTEAHDPALLEDPSLIIYHPVRTMGDALVVTNGDQTDTIVDFLEAGKTFEQALDTREFEPDAPNFTPRISAMLTFENGDFTYQMSILKSADAAGSACNRFLYDYAPKAGVGHFLHTYVCDGNPIPSFQGEPERIRIADDIDEFTQRLWNALNEANKISLYVRYVDLKSGKTENRLVNKNREKKG